MDLLFLALAGVLWTLTYGLMAACHALQRLGDAT